MLLALSVNSEESITSFLFYLMQYSITNLNAFFVLLAFGYIMHGAMALGTGTEVTFISQLKGQFQANPVLGLSLALCLFSMAGIPPLVGFFAKYRVLYSAIENGYYFLAIVGILASVVSAAYYLRVIRVIHFDSMGATEGTTSGSLTSTHSYIIAVLTLFILLFILSPSLLLNSSNLLALSLFTA
jgi:NADH-ubiquinone oxidoreductase chain 2